MFLRFDFYFSEMDLGKTGTVGAMTKNWFDAVSSGSVEWMQQLISDRIPVDIVNEVILAVCLTVNIDCNFINFCIYCAQSNFVLCLTVLIRFCYLILNKF